MVLDWDRLRHAFTSSALVNVPCLTTRLFLSTAGLATPHGRESTGPGLSAT